MVFKRAFSLRVQPLSEFSLSTILPFFSLSISRHLLINFFFFQRNGYMYPIENIYEGAYNNHTNSTNLNTHNSSKRKSKKSIQRQHSQFSHFNQPSQQMTSQCVKLLDNHNNLSNLTGSTLHSNTNNTNSNFFASPATTSTSASPSGTSTSKNRRHMGDTSLDRFKSRLTNKLRSYCTWKCLAAVFLFIIINLFTFIVYLSGKLCVF